jgi:hypothetical protein
MFRKGPRASIIDAFAYAVKSYKDWALMRRIDRILAQGRKPSQK